MTADEASRVLATALDIFDDLTLGAADVCQQAGRGTRTGGSSYLPSDLVDGRTEYHEIGLSRGGGKIEPDFVDDPALPGRLQALAAPTDTDDPCGKSALFRGQANGTAQQTDAYDRQRRYVHRAIGKSSEGGSTPAEILWKHFRNDQKVPLGVQSPCRVKW
jgi:hypothetical protein